MSGDFTTDKRRVDGLGTAHKGTGAWVRERASSIVLLPLTLWGLWAIMGLEHFSYGDVVRWLRMSTLNPVLLILLVLTSVYHMHLGLKVVIEDYLHAPAGKGSALLLNLVVCLVLAAACVFSILRVAFAGDVGVPI